MDAVKKCFKCGETKTLSAFYKHKAMSDGYLGKCKDCTKDDSRKRLANLHSNYEWRIKERARGREKAKRKNYKKGSSENISKWSARWRENNKKIKAATTAVGLAIRSGKIERPKKCSICKREGIIQGHHSDYNRPLDIVWVCVKCHHDLHVKIREDLLMADLKTFTYGE